jgi:hypothetical protein
VSQDVYYVSKHLSERSTPELVSSAPEEPVQEQGHDQNKDEVGERQGTLNAIQD